MPSRSWWQRKGSGTSSSKPKHSLAKKRNLSMNHFARLLLALQVAPRWHTSLMPATESVNNSKQPSGVFPSTFRLRPALMKINTTDYDDDDLLSEWRKRLENKVWSDVVSRALLMDLSDILEHDVGWGNFAYDFELTDVTNITLKGLSLNQALLRLLRNLHTNLTADSDHDNMLSIETWKTENSESALSVRYNFTIAGVAGDYQRTALEELASVSFPELPYINLLQLERTLHTDGAFQLRVSCTCTFHFDLFRGRIKSMKMVSWSINDRQLQFSDFPTTDKLIGLEKLVLQKEAMGKLGNLEFNSTVYKQRDSSGDRITKAASFPNMSALPVEVLHAQLGALAVGNLSQAFSLFSPARRHLIQEYARQDISQLPVSPERINAVVDLMLAQNCPGLLYHSAAQIVGSHGDPHPAEQVRLATWTYRVKIGLKHFIFVLTRQNGFDDNSPEAEDGFGRCWFVWSMEPENIDGNAPVSSVPDLASG